jgi:hypothetical protein
MWTEILFRSSIRDGHLKENAPGGSVTMSQIFETSNVIIKFLQPSEYKDMTRGHPRVESGWPQLARFGRRRLCKTSTPIRLVMRLLTV